MFCLVVSSVLTLMSPSMVRAESSAPILWPTDGAAHPRLVRSMQAVYLVDKGKRRWITSPQVFMDFRFREEWIEQIPDDDLNRIGLGPDLIAGPVLCDPDNKIWIVFQGSRHLVVAPDAYAPLSLSSSNVVLVTEDVVTTYPIGRPYGNDVGWFPLPIYIFALILTMFYGIVDWMPNIVSYKYIKILKSKTSYILIAAVFICLRIYFVSLYPWLPDGADSQAYAGAAWHLINGNSIFTENIYRSFIGVTSPLYPLFLYVFTPILFFTKFNIIGWKLVQVTLTIILAEYTRRVSLFILNPHVSSFVSLISLASPIWFYSADLIQYELLFAVLLIAGMYHYLRLISKGSILDAIVAGVFWGFAVFCQLKSLLVVAFLWFFLIYRDIRANSPQNTNISKYTLFVMFFKSLLNVRAIMFVFLLTIPSTLWGIRNLITHGEFIISSVGSGVVLWMGNYDRATGGIMGPSRPSQYDRYAELYINDHSVLKESRIYTAIALDEIASNPSRFFYLAFIKIDRFWWALFPERIADRLESRTSVFFGNVLNPLTIRSVSMLLNVFSILMILYALFSRSKVVNSSNLYLFILFFFVSMFCIIHIPFLSEPRYRIPVIPFIEIMSVLGFTEAANTLSARYAQPLRDES